jgi:hypothetical protein
MHYCQQGEDSCYFQLIQNEKQQITAKPEAKNQMTMQHA